jgi:hypothetical protein
MNYTKNKENLNKFIELAEDHDKILSKERRYFAELELELSKQGDLGKDEYLSVIARKEDQPELVTVDKDDNVLSNLSVINDDDVLKSVYDDLLTLATIQFGIEKELDRLLDSTEDQYKILIEAYQKGLILG